MGEANIERIIKKAVKESLEVGISTGYSIRQQEVKNYYKQTEKRLYAYNSLKSGIEAYKEEIEELEFCGVPGKSKSIVYMPSGSRISGQDLLEAKMQDLRYKIQSNEREIQNINNALESIKDDPWYKVIEYRYLNDKKDDENKTISENKSDSEIAELLNCDESTIRRHRKQLINKIVIRFYGADALL